MPIRPIIMSCSKTRGIYRINLNQELFEKEVEEFNFNKQKKFC
jgi:hypothetical protein